LQVERQKGLPVVYRRVKGECGFRLDLVVNEVLILELKAVERFDRVHEAQLHTYLRLTGLRLGLLINFNLIRLTDGIKRIVYSFPD
jgi:GxxExxY protein